MAIDKEPSTREAFFGCIGLFVTVGIVVLAVRSCGSSDKEIPTYEAGKWVRVGDLSYRVGSASWTKKIERSNAHFLLVDLTVRNDDDESRIIPGFDLLDDRGATHSRTITNGVEGTLGVLDELNPGVEKQGYVAFKVPPGDYKLKVSSGAIWSGDEALIELKPVER